MFQCLAKVSWREERADFEGVCEQFAGEWIGQSVAVFGNSLLEREEGKL